MFRATPQKTTVAENKKITITHDDLVSVKAFNTFEPNGKLKTTLSVEETKRSDFFNQNPLVKALLKRHLQNPILEEGEHEDNKRDHIGEFFITPEALALLINKKIRQHKVSKEGLLYNTTNVFVINNDLEKLRDTLSLLSNLKDKEDAKLIYIDEVHAIPIYLRNEDGQIKCFNADSQSLTRASLTIAHYVQTYIPKSLVVLSGANQQKDFYSCFTFAIKALMYFCKHGADIFPHIEKVGTEKHPKCDFQILDAAHLMPTLLKLSQIQLNLSEDALNTVVSFKSKKTLREYLKQNEVRLKDKSYNAAALKKRYKFFAEISEILAELEVKSLNSEAYLPLPGKVMDVVRDMSTLPKRQHFVDTCEELVHYLENPPMESKKVTPVTLSDEAKSLHKQLKQHFDYYDTHCKMVFKAIELEHRWETSKIALLQKILFIGLYASLKDIRLSASYASNYACALLQYFNNFENVIKELKQQKIINAHQLANKLCNLNLEMEEAKDMKASFDNSGIRFVW